MQLFTGSYPSRMLVVYCTVVATVHVLLMSSICSTLPPRQMLQMWTSANSIRHLFSWGMQSTEEKKPRNRVNAYGTLDNKLSVGAVQVKQKILALKMPHR
jgi:L-asparagine transporter-like permease